MVLPIGEAACISASAGTASAGRRNWLGFDNYLQVFETRGVLHSRSATTILIIVVSLVIQLPLAMAAAIALAERFKGAVAFRMMFFLPYVLAEIATGMIFSFVYDGNYGLLPIIYAPFGVEAPHLLASASTAFLAILVVIIWKYFGFHMMLYIAALQAMDRNLIEAARIDGASRWQVLRHITIPLLLPDHPPLRVLRGDRLAAALRPDHAADARRPGGFLADHGELPLHTWRDAHARGLRQRHRRHPVHHLRDLRVHV